MRIGPLACALSGVVLLACSRTDLVASPGVTNDAHPVMPDAAATVDADTTPEGAAVGDVPGAPACHVDPSIAAVLTPACTLTLPPTSCGPSEYAVGCGASFSLSLPDGCFNPCPSCNGNTGYCARAWTPTPGHWQDWQAVLALPQSSSNQRCGASSNYPRAACIRGACKIE